MPETVRNMYTYDVYMLLCGDIARITNDYHEERQKKFANSKGKLSDIPIDIERA